MLGGLKFDYNKKAIFAVDAFGACCINSAALRFIPKEEMELKGYGDYLKYL